VILPKVFVILPGNLHKSTLFIGETVIHISQTRFQEKGGSYAPGLVEETLSLRLPTRQPGQEVALSVGY
jgi:hypothetical protein